MDITAILRTAAESTEGITIDPIVTGYGDLKIPVLSIIMMGVASVLLLGAMVFGFLVIINRTDNWGTGLLAGIGSYLIFCYLIYMLLQLGLNTLPFTKETVQSNPEQFTSIMTILSGLLVCVAIFLALKYTFNQAMKRGKQVTIGAPLAVGVGMFTAAALLNHEISTTVQYMAMCISINQMGFDAAVTATVQSMVSGGEYALEEATKLAVDSILSVVNEPSLGFLMNALYYISIGVLETASAVLVYGYMNEKLEQKWIFVGFGGLMLSVIPNVLATLVGLPNAASVSMIVVIAAAVAFATIRLAKKYMPEDVKSLGYNHRKSSGSGGFGGDRKDKTPPKMPHIVMPTDK